MSDIIPHPDDHKGLNDWPVYGPRNPEISVLVERLARERNLRLAEIEDIIKNALRTRLLELDEPGNQPRQKA